MKGRIPHLVIVGGSLTFLSSLYLPWAATLGRGFSLNGWSSEFGGAAGLLALALIASEVLKLVGRSAIFRLPLPTAALALLFLSVMTALRLWNKAWVYGPGQQREIGMYLGLASAAAVFIAAVGPRALTFAPRLSPAPAIGIALALALLAAVLVPQLPSRFPPHLSAKSAEYAYVAYQLSFQGGVLQVAIAVLACFSLRLWGAHSMHVRASRSPRPLRFSLPPT